MMDATPNIKTSRESESYWKQGPARATIIVSPFTIARTT